MPAQVAGRYPFDFRINDGVGLGRAAVDPSQLQYTLDGRTLAITVHPHVSGISQSGSGSLGGATLTIDGTGFSDVAANNTVVVAGAPCAILASSATQIQCTLGAAPSQDLAGPVFAGSRGLLLEYYNDTGSDWTRPVFLSHIAEGSVGISGRYANNFAYQSHRERLSGLFTAPVTGLYTFLITGDDRSELYLSPNVSATGLARIALTANWNTPSTWYAEAGQVSAPVNLTQGSKYFFRIQHLQGSGPGYVRVGVRVHNTPAAGGWP